MYCFYRTAKTKTQKNSSLFVLSKIFTCLAEKNVKKIPCVFGVNSTVRVCTCRCSHLQSARRSAAAQLYYLARYRTKICTKKPKTILFCNINIIYLYYELLFSCQLENWKRVGTKILICMRLNRLYYLQLQYNDNIQFMTNSQNLNVKWIIECINNNIIRVNNNVNFVRLILFVAISNTYLLHFPFFERKYDVEYAWASV